MYRGFKFHSSLLLHIASESSPDFRRFLSKLPREQDYLVIEGNYLLLDREFWRDLSKYWDYKIFLTVEQAVLKARLIKRWLAENHTYSEAEARVANNDLINANLVNSYKIEPTLELQTV